MDCERGAGLYSSSACSMRTDQLDQYNCLSPEHLVLVDDTEVGNGGSKPGVVWRQYSLPYVQRSLVGELCLTIIAF